MGPLACLFAGLALSAQAGASTSAPQDPLWEAVERPQSWSQFGAEEGLPDPRIRTLAEDKDGVLWVGTWAGAAWFDGYRWNATNDAAQAEPTPVRRIVRHPAGGMVMQRGQQLVRMTVDGGDEVLRAGPTGTGGLISFADFGEGELRAIVVEGTRWTAERLDGSDPITLPISGNRRPPLVESIEAGARSWLAWQGQLYGIEAGQWEVQGLAPKGAIGGGVLDPQTMTGVVWSTLSTHYAKLWTGCAKTAFAATGLGETRWPSHLSLSADGRAVVPYVGKGLGRRGADGSWRFDPEPHPVLQEATCTLLSSSGHLWVGTHRGLFLVDSSPPALRFTLEEAAVLPGPTTQSLSMEADGTLWSGLAEGLGCIDPSGQVQIIQEAAGFPLDPITGTAFDHQGRLWIASGSRKFPGVIRFDRNQAQGSSFEHVALPDPVQSFPIHQVVQGREGRMWLLPLPHPEAQGLPRPTWIQGSSHGQLQPWPGDTERRYYDVVEHPDGSIWVASAGGLLRYENPSPECLPTRIEGLRRRRVFCLALRADGSLLAGHQDSGFGLAQIQPDGSSEYIPVQEGFDSPFVYDVAEDPDGDLWVASPQGLLRYDGSEWVNLGQEASELQGAICVLPTEDSVFVGSLGGGTSRLSPRRSESPSPRIDFEPASSASGLTTLAWSCHAYLGKVRSAEIWSRYAITRGAGRAGEGPPRWSNWSRDRRHQLELPPGDYALQVQARSGSPSTGRGTGSLPFSVPKPPGRKGIYGAGVLLLGLAGALSAFQVRKRRQGALALKESEAKYRSLVEGSPDAIALVSGETITYGNPSSQHLLGLRGGESATDLGLGPLLNAEPGPDGSRFLPSLRLDMPDGSQRFAEASSTPIPYGSGWAQQVVLRDVTDRLAAEARQQLLARELDHRVKNNLAGVLGMTEQALARATDMDEVRNTISGRIRAMARAHEALAAASWDGVRLRDLVRLIVSPSVDTPERLELNGPDTVLPPHTASPLGMVLHELCTNASKYGALSAPAGRIRLHWWQDAQALRLAWTESQGPRLSTQPCPGLGLRILRGVIEHELDGEVQVEFAPEGLQAELRIPLERSP